MKNDRAPQHVSTPVRSGRRASAIATARALGVVVGGVMLIGLLVPATAGATDDAAVDAACADVELGLSERMHPNYRVAGPFSVSVPAGTYRIHATSTDPNHVEGYQPDQRHESWSFSTDTGYRSPITPDLPEVNGSATFDLGEVTFDTAVSSISFHWEGDPANGDSVAPQLTLSCVVGSQSTTTIAPTTAAPTTAAPTTAAPTTVAPTTVAPTTVATTAAPTSAPTTSAQTGKVLPSSTVASKNADPDPGTLPRTGNNPVLGWLAVGLVGVGAVFASTGRISRELVES